MEAQILEVVRERKKEFDKALEARSVSYKPLVRTTIQKHRQLTLGPHGFFPQTGDVCQIQPIRKLIIKRTDREFNAGANKFSSGLPDFTSAALFPFKGRSDNILSLATVWFGRRLCYQNPIHGIDASKNHQLLTLVNNPLGKPVDTTIIDLRVLEGHGGCCAKSSEFTFLEFASTIAQGLILDCGEDPESITLAELNSKDHQFVFYENGELVAHNWEETVSPTSLLGVH